MARTLKAEGDHALVLWAGAGFCMAKNFSMWRHKATQCLRVFIVYCRNFVAAEVANLFYYWCVVSLLWSHKNVKIKVKSVK